MNAAGAEFKNQLKARARELGFAQCGITSAEDLLPEVQAQLLEWLARGYHDKMEYLARNPLQRTRPAELLAEARSIICLSAQYTAQHDIHDLPSSSGRIARYARGLDYHYILDKPLKELERWMIENGGEGTHTRRFCDAGPIMERQFAQRAGLGFIGRHGLLITPQAGSWVLLAAIMTNLEIAPDLPASGTCGRCRRCIEACPTGALTQDFVLDARKCISNLTIERKGEFSCEEERMLGQWVFGCDICQELCPYNKRPAIASFEELNPVRFPNGIIDFSILSEISSNSEFQKQFQYSPLLRSRLKGLRRNAQAVEKNKTNN